MNGLSAWKNASGNSLASACLWRALTSLSSIFRISSGNRWSCLFPKREGRQVWARAMMFWNELSGMSNFRAIWLSDLGFSAQIPFVCLKHSPENLHRVVFASRFPCGIISYVSAFRMVGFTCAIMRLFGRADTFPSFSVPVRGRPPRGALGTFRFLLENPRPNLTTCPKLRRWPFASKMGQGFRKD